MKQKKVLIVAPSWVGDMMMAQSLMISLKQQNPNVMIDVLAPSWTQALTSRMPEVNQAILSPFKHGNFGLMARLKLGRELKKCQYDEAYVLPNSFKSALVPFFARIPKRIGWCGEARFGLLNSIRFLNKKAYPLMVQRFAALAYPVESSLGKMIRRPKLVLHSDQTSNTLKDFGITQSELADKKIMAICPGAEFGPSKRWPEAHFVKLMNELSKKGWTIWLFGSEKDKPIRDEILAKAEINCLDFVGKTSLDQAIDLLSIVQGVVTNDSGLMHIACALEKPVVAIYGSTSTNFTPPLGAEKVKILQLSLPCSPCFKRTCPLGHHQCMQDILPEQVIKAVDALCVF
jgi:heptosyltransferase-2